MLVTPTEPPAPEQKERVLPMRKEEEEAFVETLEEVEAAPPTPAETAVPPERERIPFTLPPKVKTAPGITELQAPRIFMTPVEVREAVVTQIRANLPSAGQTVELNVTPADPGTVKVQVSPHAAAPSVQVTASQSMVGAMLENSVPQAKSLFSAVGMDPAQVTVILNSSASASAGDQPQDQFSSFLSGQETAKPQGSFVDTAAAGTEAMLAQRYGIRDLHQHLMDQIRVAVDPSRNEAKIRLHPPELGEIRIHLVMEDKAVTVRMDVAEHMTRVLLERDLDQLKNTLADAGIEVSRFDIHSEQQRSRTKKEGNKKDASPETVEEESGAGLDEPEGPVDLGAHREGVDYLVY